MSARIVDVAGPPPIVSLGGVETPYVQFFRDGREGTDRWGRERKRLKACGTGWGEDEYVCPAYAEEACPGDGNPGVRMAPLRTHKCDLLCGKCGGGGRSETMAYCGWPRAEGPWRIATGEMGGSMRLDRFKAMPAQPMSPLGIEFMPSVEWRDARWYHQLDEWYGGTYPWLATTLRTAQPGTEHGRRTAKSLRDRFGGYQGKMLVHGLLKDDQLDDAWDKRKRIMRWCLDEGVEALVTPQYSYYGDDQSCMTLYNANRMLRWYCEAVEMGFPHVGLDWPPWFYRWMRADYLKFVIENDVKLLCISYQTILNKRWGLNARALDELRHLNDEIPEDVTFLFFGLTTLGPITQICMLIQPPRNIAFSSSGAYAKAALFKLAPGGDSAPKKMSKADVFTYNVNVDLRFVRKAFAARERRAEKLRAIAERRRAAGVAA